MMWQSPMQAVIMLPLEVNSLVVDQALKYLVKFLICITAVACYSPLTLLQLLLLRQPKKKSNFFMGGSVAEWSILLAIRKSLIVVPFRTLQLDLFFGRPKFKWTTLVNSCRLPFASCVCYCCCYCFKAVFYLDYSLFPIVPVARKLRAFSR